MVYTIKGLTYIKEHDTIYLYRCHCLGCSEHNRFSIHFKVPLNFSTNPLHIGWYGDVVSCRILKSLDTSAMHSDTNWAPISLRTSSGTPRRLYMSTNASITKIISVHGRSPKFLRNPKWLRVLLFLAWARVVTADASCQVGSGSSGALAPGTLPIMRS